MTYPTFCRRFFALLILAFALLAYWNYTLDIYGIFKEDYVQRRIEINQHFVKMRYLLKNPERYNAFLFGSSRVGNIDVTKFPGNDRYYNMTNSEGLPQEWLHDLKNLVAADIKFKRIIVGLDEFSYKRDPSAHENELLRMPYTDKALFYYIKLLAMRPNQDVLNAIWSADELGSRFDIYGTGQPLHEQADARIEADMKKHIIDEKFLKPMQSTGHRVEETLFELKQMKKITEAQGGEFIVIFNPIYSSTYLAADRNEMNDFKRRLSVFTDFYDFSGINETTTNNYNYYEVSHYRPLVGDKIAARLSHPGPDDSKVFGVYVTSDNVDEHLVTLATEEQRYKTQMKNDTIDSSLGLR